MTESIIYPFEHIEVTLSGIRWQASGTAILKSELGQVFTEPGWIAVEQVDRLDSQGRLDYEDFDFSLWFPEERLNLVGALAIKINAQPDLGTWYFERIDQ